MLLQFRTTEHKQCLEITDRVRDAVRESGVERGLCHVAVLHATAAIVVNENDDPNIGVDLLTALDRAIPDHAGWLHDRVDDNAQAHIKAAILRDDSDPRRRSAARHLAGRDPRRARRPACRAPGRDHDHHGRVSNG